MGIFHVPTKPINFSNALCLVYVPLFYRSMVCSMHACQGGLRIFYLWTHVECRNRRNAAAAICAIPSHSKLTIHFQRSMKNAIRIRCRCPIFPVEHILFPKRSLRNEAGPSVNPEAVKPCYYY